LVPVLDCYTFIVRSLTSKTNIVLFSFLSFVQPIVKHATKNEIMHHWLRPTDISSPYCRLWERILCTKSNPHIKVRNRLLIENQHKLMLIKTCTNDIVYNKEISEWRSAKQRKIYQSSWIAWPIRLWLLWGIVLWKETMQNMNSFSFDKMHMLYNQNNSCVKSCKNIAL